MFKPKVLTVAALIFGTVFLSWAGLASAQTFKSGNTVTVGQGEIVNDTLFLTGRNIDVSSEVFGDVFCAGQTISISGKINGDIICAGQTINVTGEVTGDVRLAGQTVTVSAPVRGNASIGTQSFTLGSEGSIGGDVSIASADTTLNGSVERDVIAGSETLVIANNVGRNVKAAVTNLTLLSGANVGGSIDYTSQNELNRQEGATVSGSVSRKEPPAETKDNYFNFGFTFGWLLYIFLALMFAALAVALLFPQMLQTVTSRALPRPWKPLLVGFLASLVVPALLLILAISVIGLPFAIMAWLVWVVIVLLSGIVFAYYVGRLILRESRQPIIIMLIGAAVLLVIYFIPFIGALAIMAALWTGSGMLLLELFDRTPRPVYSLEESHLKTKK